MTAQILFIAERGDNPSAYYRCVLPARGLSQLGHRAIVGHHLSQGRTGVVFCPGQQMAKPDVVITRRMTAPDGSPVSCETMFRDARANGQQVWLDLDDDFWHLPEWNPARRWVTTDVQEQWVADANAATGVIVTTPELATVVIEQGVTSRVVVAQNSVDATQFRRRMAPGSALRVGWLGETRYRGPDLATIAPQLREVLATTAVKTEFWWLGATSVSPDVKEFIGDDFPVPIVRRDWVPCERLHESIGELNVAIVPQADTVFALSRSAVTGLALAAGGVPFAATATPAYERLFNSGAGLPVHEPVNDTGGWEQALRVLIEPEYEEAREAIQSGGLMVARQLNPATVAARYVEAFGL